MVLQIPLLQQQPVPVATCGLTGCNINTPGDCVSSHCTCTTPPCSCTFTPQAPARTGPEKNNLIGFTTVSCSGVTSAQYAHFIHNTTSDTSCELDVTTYTLGAFGQISGTEYIGFNVKQNGVVDENDNLTSSAGNTDVCT